MRESAVPAIGLLHAGVITGALFNSARFGGANHLAVEMIEAVVVLAPVFAFFGVAHPIPFALDERFRRAILNLGAIIRVVLVADHIASPLHRVFALFGVGGHIRRAVAGARALPFVLAGRGAAACDFSIRRSVLAACGFIVIVKDYVVVVRSVVVVIENHVIVVVAVVVGCRCIVVVIAARYTSVIHAFKSHRAIGVVSAEKTVDIFTRPVDTRVARAGIQTIGIGSALKGVVVVLRDIVVGRRVAPAATKERRQNAKQKNNEFQFHFGFSILPSMLFIMQPMP